MAPGCKASGRGNRVTHLLGYPMQNVSRSLRRKYAPPPCGGPEDVALAARPADPSSKATLWGKAQHEGALPPPCIVRKDPRVPHTARRGA